VVGLLEARAGEVGHGEPGGGGYGGGDELVVGVAGGEGALRGGAGGEGPAGAGVRDELRGGDLDGLGALIGDVEVYGELLARDDGLGGGLTGAISEGALAGGASGDSGEDAETEGLAKSVVELLLFDEQFVSHVVLCFGGELAGGDVAEEAVGLHQTVSELR